MAQDLAQKKLAYIAKHISRVGDFIAAWQRLVESRTEWDALGYSAGIVQGDITQNVHLTPTILADSQNTQSAIKAVLDAGHLTNLYKILG